jgi:acetolactate synthase regulatory subunit
MELHMKTFRLRVERDVALATMEAVLSVVRRGGLALHSLNLAPGRHGVDVLLHVGADEAEPLQLCRTRLCNLIGILKIRELPASAGAG